MRKYTEIYREIRGGIYILLMKVYRRYVRGYTERYVKICVDL